MRIHPALIAAMLASAACHPGPVVDTGPKPAPVGGTIAGIVSTDTNAPVAGRQVTATNTASSERFEATTGENGGYTIKVPQGTYRVEVQLKPGENLAKQPGETTIDRSDLDSHRDFVITLARVR
jgi:hypothetical protein